MAVGQTAADKVEKTRQAAASLGKHSFTLSIYWLSLYLFLISYSFFSPNPFSTAASYNYQYLIAAIVGFFILRNIIITIRSYLNRRKQNAAQQKLLSTEKGISINTTTRTKFSPSFTARWFDQVERWAVERIRLNFYPFSGEKGMNWIQLIVVSLIVGINIAFTLVSCLLS